LVHVHVHAAHRAQPVSLPVEQLVALVVALQHAAVRAPVQMVDGRAVARTLGKVSEARGRVVCDPPPEVERLALGPEAILVVLRGVQVDALVGRGDGLARVRLGRVSGRARPACGPCLGPCLRV